MMKQHEAQERAMKLGMSAWTTEAIAMGREGSESVELCCVGFHDINFTLVEAESWDEAWSEVIRIIFRS